MRIENTDSLLISTVVFIPLALVVSIGETFVTTDCGALEENDILDREPPRYDIVIIGAGCIGGATAKILSEDTDFQIAILEKEHHLAVHQSGRNSGVLHPGFNYEPGSLKAEFASTGTKELKEYARTRGIPLAEFGVLVVAQTDAEELRLKALAEQGRNNGVEVELLHGQEELREYEPYAVGQAGLFAPEAASISAQQYVYSLINEAVDAGTDLYLDTRFESVTTTNPGPHRLTTSKGVIYADYVVNAAGLYADRVAAEFGHDLTARIIPFRGEYYEVIPARRELCQTMIYPTPDPSLPFLGVHFTRRVDGSVIVGPNAVLAFGREAYRNYSGSLRELVGILGYRGFQRLMTDRDMLSIAVDELNKSYRKSAFTEAAQCLVPDIEPTDLRRSFSGIRAQLVSADGELVNDPQFVHLSGSSHVLNAVSPGLTSSLTVGKHLSEKVKVRFEGDESD